MGMYGPPTPSEACCSRLFEVHANAMQDRLQIGDAGRHFLVDADEQCRLGAAQPRNAIRLRSEDVQGRKVRNLVCGGSLRCMEERRRETAHGLIQEACLGRTAGAGLRIGILWHGRQLRAATGRGRRVGADAVAGKARAARMGDRSRIGILALGSRFGAAPT